MNIQKAGILTCLLLLASTLASAADTLYFSAPPREGSQQNSLKIYQPIVDELSSILQQPVAFRYEENFFK